MSEAEIVRLVRCPKCENLLPELAGYSVYQCGGCGAVLRAKVKQDAVILDEKSDKEKLGVHGKLVDLSGKGVQGDLKSSSESGVTGRDFSNEDIGSDCLAFSSKENSGVKMDKYSNPQCVPNYESVAKVDPHASAGISTLGNTEKPTDFVGNVSRFQGSEHMSRLPVGISGQYENGRDGNEVGRPLNLNYQEDGPSNYISASSCNNAEPREDVNGFNMPKNNGSLPKDRAELLQMMEELSDQLRRSGNLGENLKDKSPMNQNAAKRGCNRSYTSGMFKSNIAGPSSGMHHGFMPDKPTISPYHDPHYLPHYPHGGRQRNEVSNSHHLPYGLSDMPGYGNYSEMQMMRDTLPTPNHFEHQMSHPRYHTGQPFADDPIIYAPNSNNGLPYHPVCGFYNCCSDHHRATQPDYLDDTRFYEMHNNSMLYPQHLAGPSTQRGYNLKTSGLSSDHSVRTRLADKDMGCYTRGFVRRRQQKDTLAKVGPHCHPTASGAPFIICQGCSKLLQLPKMTFKRKSKRQILRCGACNTVMVCALVNKKFTISVSGESKKIVKGVSPHLDDLTREGISSELGWAKVSSVSDDYYNSSHEFQAINGNPHVITSGLDLTSNETQDSHSLPASSPDSFEGVESSENLASLSPHDLPPQDQLGHFFNGNVTNRVWKGSQSTRSDHEKVMAKDMISRQNSLNETSMTAQMEEVSFNVSSKTGVSQNPEPTTHSNDIEKIMGSSFADVIKKGLKGLSKSNHSADNRARTVTVNGCKIPGRLVKKAEKLAGPIHPGNYWYDFRAGFWGVIGGPCLGIIPPCIEEFNYPMQANCSSGATGVFVNGRELQQIDLDLLASRGLPTARGRSYIIEISGKVVDKDKGEELDGLGKLAPTIEKVKHGFGMKSRTQIVQ